MRWGVATGSTRWVILTPRFAVKVPRADAWRLFLHGLLANLQERVWWRLTRDPRLCPVRFAFPLGVCVVMERAMPHTGAVEDTAFDGLPYDPRPDNVGELAGRVVLIDYGS